MFLEKLNNIKTETRNENVKHLDIFVDGLPTVLCKFIECA